MSPPADPAERSRLLREWALEEGFDRAGVARLDPSEHGEALRRWVERGDHAAMEWIRRRVDAREDPAQLLSGARTALCVALVYWPLEPGPDDPPGVGDRAGDLWSGVARYARGRDYHDVMMRRLRRLGDRIEAAFPGSRSRSYVDTGPILERELAARAGIGVFGKNTNLLERRAGSWFLLGEILLTVEAEPSEPLSDLCGRCTRCLDACPTGALPEPYRLDSRLCISYWTIEHRGPLPEEVRDGVGEWVFGCDVCQEVCPWNHKVESVDHPPLRLPRERGALDLTGLLGLGREGYVERFRKSPMKRAKLEGLQRNAAVAMGNRGDARYVEPLADALHGNEAPVVRGHAAWALGKIARPAGKDGASGSQRVAAVLEAAEREETDPTVRSEIVAALRRVGARGIDSEG